MWYFLTSLYSRSVNVFPVGFYSNCQRRHEVWLYSNSQQTNKKANRVRDAVRTAEHGDGGLQAAADKNSHTWVMLSLWGKPDDGVGVCRKQPFGGHLIWKVHLIKTGQRSCLKRIDYSRGRWLSELFVAAEQSSGCWWVQLNPLAQGGPEESDHSQIFKRRTEGLDYSHFFHELFMNLLSVKHQVDQQPDL